MRIRIIILLILSVSQANCQKKVLGIATNHANPAPSSQPVLFIISGESNATGYADNGFASGPELASRNLKILNNESYIFEGLDIGTNNILNAAGSITNCPGCTTHGMELQLANSYDSNYFSPHPCFLVKGGQGGSYISEWDNTDAFYDSLVNRISRAYSLIFSQYGIDPVVVWIYSQGINDMILGTSSSSWKTSTKTLFSNIRSEIDGIFGHSTTILILMTRFDGMTPNDLDYETVIGEIDSEVSNCEAIHTSTDLKDGNHWQYGGLKDNVRRMKASIQAFINQ